MLSSRTFPATRLRRARELRSLSSRPRGSSDQPWSTGPNQEPSRSPTSHRTCGKCAASSPPEWRDSWPSAWSQAKFAIGAERVLSTSSPIRAVLRTRLARETHDCSKTKPRSGQVQAQYPLGCWGRVPPRGVAAVDKSPAVATVEESGVGGRLIHSGGVRVWRPSSVFRLRFELRA